MDHWLKALRLGTLIFLSLILWLLAPLPVRAEPSKKPISTDWKLVAKSDLVAKGKLNVPLSTLEAMRGKILRVHEEYYWERVEVQATIEDAVKGRSPGRAIPVEYFVEQSKDSPSARILEEYRDQQTILFLYQRGGSDGYAGHLVSETVRPFNVDQFSSIAREVENQRQIAEEFDQLPIGEATAADAKVRDLFEKLTRRRTRETPDEQYFTRAAVWKQLLKLNRRDVPAIVRLMDNPQLNADPLPIDLDVYVPNPPEVAKAMMESIRHSTPERIVEAASLLLAHIAQDPFWVVEDGTDQERAANVNAWRCWCYYNY